jgi:hypothetical protein
MAFNLDAFRASLQYDGARPNLFEVIMVPPTALADALPAGQKMRFMARSAQLPGKTIGSVPVYYFGREIKVPGNAMFQEWTLTIMNDEDFAIRKVMERWHGAINSHQTNVRAGGFMNFNGYSVNASVVQYSKGGTGQINGAVRGRASVAQDGATGLRKYNFVGMWPIDISPIDLDWGANDQIEEFVVTFAYQWWEVEGDRSQAIASKVQVG